MVKRVVKALLKYPLTAANYLVLDRHYQAGGQINREIDGMLRQQEGRVLVLAPHVDDETIGPGGALIRHCELGHQVLCLYITDGAASVTEYSREEIIAERRAEAEKIKQRLGIGEMHFLDLPDGAVRGDEALARQIGDFLESFQPTVLYAPFLLDGHNDHVETTRALSRALSRWNPRFQELYLYETNCPVVPRLVNAVCTMDAKTFAKKENLLEIFQSQQIMSFDGFLLLNRKQGRLAEAYGAEVFVKADAGGLAALIDYLDRAKFSYSSFRQVSNRYNLLLGFLTGYGKKTELSREIGKILVSPRTEAL